MKERKQREEKGNGKKNKAGYTADGWAGAVMQKLLKIQKCDGPIDLPTYQPTDRHSNM